MNIKKLNLNLLFTLDALLSECNVTRAGEKLFLSQSTMSNALNQLRDIFQDELLVRGARGMIPTARGLELLSQVKPVLHDIEQLFQQQEEFDPKTSQRVFKIGMSDYAEYCILPQLMHHLQRQAPHIELRIEHRNYINDATPFENNVLELAVGTLVAESPHLMTEKLFPILGAVMARKNHPLMKEKITLERYLSARHIRVQYQEIFGDTKIDNALKRLGCERNAVLTIPHVLPALHVCQQTDLLVTLPNFISPSLANKLQLSFQALPFTMEECIFHQTWHRQAANDSGLAWLRDLIRSITVQQS